MRHSAHAQRRGAAVHIVCRTCRDCNPLMQEDQPPQRWRWQLLPGLQGSGEEAEETGGGSPRLFPKLGSGPVAGPRHTKELSLVCSASRSTPRMCSTQTPLPSQLPQWLPAGGRSGHSTPPSCGLLQTVAPGQMSMSSSEESTPAAGGEAKNWGALQKLAPKPSPVLQNPMCFFCF